MRAWPFQLMIISELDITSAFCIVKVKSISAGEEKLSKLTMSQSSSMSRYL